MRARGHGAMVANANQAATPPQATQIALADLLGRNHSNRRCSHDHRNHRVSEVGIQLRRAASFPFGGLIASGWHTAGLMTRLFMDHYLTKVASLGSPGGDELRWVKPVRTDDTLSVRVTVLKAVPSKSKPDRGAVTSFVEVINQASEVVMTFKVVNIIAKRSPRS